MAGAPKGNQNALKYKTKAQRLAVVQRYVDHAKQGYSDESFPDLDPQTFKIYMQQFPIEFDTDIIGAARAQRRIFWERVGIQGTLGVPIQYQDKNGKMKEAKKGFNSRSYQFIMMNMYGQKIHNDHTSDGEKIDGPLIYLPAKLPDNYDEIKTDIEAKQNVNKQPHKTQKAT